jgi:hypothetical protein
MKKPVRELTNEEIERDLELTRKGWSSPYTFSEVFGEKWTRHIAAHPEWEGDIFRTRFENSNKPLPGAAVSK